MISLDYYSEIAGISKSDFIKFLGENEISVFNSDNEEDLFEDIDNV